MSQKLSVRDFIVLATVLRRNMKLIAQKIFARFVQARKALGTVAAHFIESFPALCVR